MIRDFGNIRILGNYVGCTMQRSFDWVKYFALFNMAKGFNGSSHHLLSPWNADEGYGPWEFQESSGAGKFLLKRKKVNGVLVQRWNEEWWTKFILMLDAAADADVLLELCLIDFYGGSKWLQYGDIASTSPFRNNDAVDVCGEDGKGLYVNWNRQNFNDKKNFKLFTWKGDDEWNIATYTAVNDTGQAFLDYIKRVAEECKQARIRAKSRGKALRLFVRLANESTLKVHGGKDIDYGKSLYIDDRSDNFCMKTFKAAGFVSGKTVDGIIPYRYVYETEVTEDGEVSLYWPEKTMRMWIKTTYLMEWHGISVAKDLDKFKDSFKTLDNFLGSADGKKEGKKADGPKYYADLKAIAKLKLKQFDYKLWAYYSGPGKWDVRNMNKNSQNFIPQMNKALFG